MMRHVERTIVEGADRLRRACPGTDDDLLATLIAITAIFDLLEAMSASIPHPRAVRHAVARASQAFDDCLHDRLGARLAEDLETCRSFLRCDLFSGSFLGGLPEQTRLELIRCLTIDKRYAQVLNPHCKRALDLLWVFDGCQPGYLSGRLRSLSSLYGDQRLCCKIDSLLLLDIHRSNTCDVLNSVGRGIRQGFSLDNVRFRSTPADVSSLEAALAQDLRYAEAFNKIQTGFIYTAYLSDETQCTIVCERLPHPRKTKEELDAALTLLVNDAFECFGCDISAAADDGDKWIAIAKLIQRLNMIHPFEDGNGRTLWDMLNLLARRLIQKGSTVMSDPNDIDWMTVERIAEQLEAGCIL